MNQPKTSSGAVCSLVFGILSLVCLGPLAGIPAIICGHSARGTIRRSNGAVAGDGLATAGLVLGYVGSVIGTLVLLLFLLPVLFGIFGDRTRAIFGGAAEELGADQGAVDDANRPGAAQKLKDYENSAGGN